MNPSTHGMEPAPMLKLREEALNWLEVEDEVIALDGNRSVYVRTNETGARLWRLLTVGTTREALISSLQAAFDIDAERAAVDVDAFIQMVKGQGLLSTEDQ